MRNCSPIRISHRGFPHDSAGKESACSAGDTGDSGLIPGLGGCSGGGHSCLENPMDREAWQATVQRVEKGQTWLISWVQAQQSAMFPKE